RQILMRGVITESITKFLMRKEKV
ncbi:PTS sorbitol transporter subunit IIC, partial [Leptospira borgpetersenii serovar Ballum]|nr:PTS sorbitol transporter subunit IIC [Leptospira borgpetersenii serovar Ballum]